MATKPARKTNGSAARAKQAKPVKATRVVAAAAKTEKVILNVPVKTSTRTGLAKLKLHLGLNNQGEVLDKLVRDGLSAMKGR